MKKLIAMIPCEGKTEEEIKKELWVAYEKSQEVRNEEYEVTFLPTYKPNIKKIDRNNKS